MEDPCGKVQQCIRVELDSVRTMRRGTGRVVQVEGEGGVGNEGRSEQETIKVQTRRELG